MYSSSSSSSSGDYRCCWCSRFCSNLWATAQNFVKDLTGFDPTSGSFTVRRIESDEGQAFTVGPASRQFASLRHRKVTHQEGRVPLLSSFQATSATESVLLKEGDTQVDQRFSDAVKTVCDWMSKKKNRQHWLKEGCFREPGPRDILDQVLRGLELMPQAKKGKKRKMSINDFFEQNPAYVHALLKDLLNKWFDSVYEPDSSMMDPVAVLKRERGAQGQFAERIKTHPNATRKVSKVLQLAYQTPQTRLAEKGPDGMVGFQVACAVGYAIFQQNKEVS